MRIPRILMACAALLAYGTAWSGDAARGAQLYMRTDANTRSCVSCHGPDPGLNHNNILRAADSPDTLTKVLNTVSAMGFLRPQLTEADKDDITAFLGTVSRLNATASPLHVWPVTMDFGNLSPGSGSQTQVARIRNRQGGANLELQSLTTISPGLSMTHDCPPALPPGGVCDIRVQWSSQGDGMLRSAVEVRTAGAASPVYVAAAAQRLPSASSLLGWANGETMLAFKGNGNGAPHQQSVRLHNAGPLPAVLGPPSITGPDAARFRIESGCATGLVLQAQTGCDMLVSYSPSLKAEVEAVLQVRSDQTNPASLRLEGGEAASATPQEPIALAPSAGGGCSVGPPDRKVLDPTLVLAAALAAASLLAQGRRRRR